MDSRPYSCVQVAWHNQGWNSPDRSPQQNFDFISAIESWGYFQFRKQKNRIFIENWRHCLSFRQVLFEKSVPRTSCTRTYELANFFAAIVWGSNLNQILILLVQSEARVISSSENSKNLIFIGNWRHCLSFRQVLFEKPVSRTSCTRTYELANFFAAVVSLGLGQRLCGCVDFQVFTTFK